MNRAVFLLALLLLLCCFETSAFRVIKPRFSVTNAAAKSRFTPLSAQKETEGFDIDKFVAGDAIFRIHSAGAASFGLLLLFSDAINFTHDPITGAAYKQWAFFILAVANITFNAPSLDKDAKVLLARTFFAMCLGESIFYVENIITKFPVYLTVPSVLIATLGSLGVFGFLTYGYFKSGNLVKAS